MLKMIEYGVDGIMTDYPLRLKELCEKENINWFQFILMDLNIVNNEEKFLAGKLEGYTLKGAENKFDDKGNPLLFPGCTIICNIPLNTDLSNEIINYQKKIENFNPKKTYFYLPPSSFHMTLFDCCNLNTKNTKYWPSNIDPNMDYKNIAIELNKRIKDLSLIHI